MKTLVGRRAPGLWDNRTNRPATIVRDFAAPGKYFPPGDSQRFWRYEPGGPKVHPPAARLLWNSQASRFVVFDEISAGT